MALDSRGFGYHERGSHPIRLLAVDIHGACHEDFRAAQSAHDSLLRRSGLV